MIQQFFSGMLALMLAKFVLNDMPHAAGLYANQGQGRKGMRLFHISPIPRLTVLLPSMPADDIIEHEFVRAVIHVDELPQKSKSVSFAGDFEVNLKHAPGPSEAGYIYEPIYEKLSEEPRQIYLELTPEMKEDFWADYDETLEHRFYNPVPVRMVGEVHWGKKGITLRVVWYDGNRQFMAHPLYKTAEVKNNRQVEVEKEDLPWMRI